jgi:hypothetical protein
VSAGDHVAILQTDPNVSYITYSRKMVTLNGLLAKIIFPVIGLASPFALYTIGTFETAILGSIGMIIATLVSLDPD